jgi:probable HAF family extracellular repeat protein
MRWSSRFHRCAAVVVLLAVTLIAGSAQSASAFPPVLSAPLPTNLGTLGSPGSVAAGVNDRGTIVGTSGTKAFARMAGETALTDLGNLPGAIGVAAMAVNNHDIAVGLATVSQTVSTAVVFDLGSGVITDLGSAPGFEQTTTSAMGISDTGVIVGEAGSSPGAAWYKLPEGPITLIPTPASRAAAYAVNDSGLVVGAASVTGDIADHAMTYDIDSATFTDLGTLGGRDSEALGINDAGQIVGDAFTAGPTGRHPFVKQPGSPDLADLGTLGGAAGVASAINDRGVVTGATVDGSGSAWFGFALSLDGGKMIKLPAFHNDGFNQTGGYAINNANVVVGDASPDGFSSTTVAAMWAVSSAPDPVTTPSVTGCDTAVLIAWPAPIFDGNTPITSYQVVRDRTPIATTKGTETRYLDLGPVADGATYTVIAVNADGPAAPSPPGVYSGVTCPPPATTPSATIPPLGAEQPVTAVEAVPTFTG